jgi:TnpA family transposase
VVLQRLANASPADRVAKALTILRVVKTIYILRYIHEDLRRRVQLQLNRVKSRHALARWLFFANRGEFRSGEYEEIMNKASCLSLLSNGVLVWNTMACFIVCGTRLTSWLWRWVTGQEYKISILKRLNLPHLKTVNRV